MTKLDLEQTIQDEIKIEAIERVKSELSEIFIDRLQKINEHSQIPAIKEIAAKKTSLHNISSDIVSAAQNIAQKSKVDSVTTNGHLQQTKAAKGMTHAKETKDENNNGKGQYKIHVSKSQSNSILCLSTLQTYLFQKRYVY